MSSLARRRLLQKPPESVTRAQKMNQLEERMLSAKINTFSREEKQLKREIEGLRKSRHFLQEKIEPLLVSRPRSHTEPRMAKMSLADSAEKLPQLVSLQSTPPRERSNSMLSVPETSGHALLSKSCEDLNALEKAEDRCSLTKFKSLTPTPRRKSTLATRTLSRVKSLDLNEREGDAPSAGARKVGIGGKPFVRRRAYSDVSQLAGVVVPAIVCEDAMNGTTDEHPNARKSLGYMTPPILSPILSRRSTASPVFNAPLHKTNRDLMEESHVISKFNVVGHRALGAALLRHRASMEADELRLSAEEPSGESANGAKRWSVIRAKSDFGPDEAETTRRITVTEWTGCSGMAVREEGDEDEDENNNNNNNNSNNISKDSERKTDN